MFFNLETGDHQSQMSDTRVVRDSLESTLIGTVLAQLTVPIRIRSCNLLFQRQLRRQGNKERRGGDSNPRWVAPHWFSRPAQSATLSPLRAAIGF